jgi:hypothetical protein
LITCECLAKVSNHYFGEKVRNLPKISNGVFESGIAIPSCVTITSRDTSALWLNRQSHKRGKHIAGDHVSDSIGDEVAAGERQLADMPWPGVLGAAAVRI